MPKTDDKLHFEVHPSVVYQLGESLISDAIQALIELVKNSYDADASYAKITIDTLGTVTIPGIASEAGRPRVIVEDDGFGMNEAEVASGWLLISNRAKRELKAQKKTTPRGRTPLGDKGLGRLGVQWLGDSLDIYTKKEDDVPVHFGFSWLDFATAPSLRDVAVTKAACELPRAKGTTIVVSDLREQGLSI